MRSLRTSCFLLLLLLCVLKNYSQDKPEIQFHLLSQEDDISFLSKKDSLSIYEKIKWLDFKNGNSISFGGGYRLQLESFFNENFRNEKHQNNIWVLNRFLFHSHVILGDQFNFFIELNSSTVNNKFDESPVDTDVLSINQAYISYQFNSNWNILVGRENLSFGAKRLVDIREGPNVRRSFDLGRINYAHKNTSASLFFSIPVQPKPNVFDNNYLDFNETFSGIYITQHFSQLLNFDLYGFYQKDNNVTYNVGTDNEKRYSIGTRFFGSLNKFTFNGEAVYQFGSFEKLDIQAFTVSLQGEYLFNMHTYTTLLGIKTEIISGDKNLNDTTLNTFDALYPRGAYFGRVAKFGPSNLIDIHPYINFNKRNFYVEIDYDAFWRYSVSDGIYGASLQLDFPSTNSKAFIGHQFGTLVGWNVNNHIHLEFETNMILPGAFLKENDLTATLFHAVISTEFKF